MKKYYIKVNKVEFIYLTNDILKLRQTLLDYFEVFGFDECNEVIKIENNNVNVVFDNQFLKLVYLSI